MYSQASIQIVLTLKLKVQFRNLIIIPKLWTQFLNVLNNLQEFMKILLFYLVSVCYRCIFLIINKYCIKHETNSFYVYKKGGLKVQINKLEELY